MKKQFVTYSIALALKEIKFDEPCILVYSDKKELHTITYSESHVLLPFVLNSKLPDKIIAAPLWQQVIGWFREKHKLNIYIIPNGVFDESKCVFRIDSKDRMLVLDKLNNVYSFVSDWMNDYEEAREAAIIEAIEIIKNKDSTKIKKD
jgi:hypothetical protein